MAAWPVRVLRAVLPRIVDYSTYAALLLLITGGVRTPALPPLPSLDLMRYGLLFLPLAACLALGYHPAGSRVVTRLEGMAARIDAMPSSRRRRYLAVSIALAVSAHALVVYLRHISFQTGIDLAIYANACRGALFSTMKGDIWLFADHLEPVLIVFTPLCRTFSPAVTLLTIQVASFGVGAFGIYALARHEGWRPSLAWLVALLYLAFAGHATLVYYDFHLVALTLGLIPWLWWALQTRRDVWVLTLGLLYLGLKESAALSLVGFGAYIALRREREASAGSRRLGVALAVIGAVSFVVIMKVVYPLFRGGEETMYFAKYYGHLGRNFAEVVTTFVTRPHDVVHSLLHPSKLWYLKSVLLPFLAFPLVRPVYLLPIAPAILINILSNDRWLFSRWFHYEAEIFPALFAMAVIAFRASRFRAFWLAVMLVVFSAPSPLGIARGYVPSADHRRLRAQLEAHVPRDKAVAAPQHIAAHLTDRERLYMFDYWGMEEDWKRADVVVLGYHGDNMGWYSRKVFEEEKLPKILPSLRLIYEDPLDPRFRLYQVTQLPGDASETPRR